MAAEIAFVGDSFIFLGITAMLVLTIVAYLLFMLLLMILAGRSGGNIIIFPSCGPSYGYGYGFGFYSPISMVGFILAGLIVSAIVVGLALHMGLPTIALGFGVAWCAAFSSVILGLAIRSSEQLLPPKNYSENGASTMFGRRVTPVVAAVPVEDGFYSRRNYSGGYVE